MCLTSGTYRKIFRASRLTGLDLLRRGRSSREILDLPGLDSIRLNEDGRNLAQVLEA